MFFGYQKLSVPVSPVELADEKPKSVGQWITWMLSMSDSHVPKGEIRSARRTHSQVPGRLKIFEYQQSIVINSCRSLIGSTRWSVVSRWISVGDLWENRRFFHRASTRSRSEIHGLSTRNPATREHLSTHRFF